MTELINTKTSLTGKFEQSINLNDLCNVMNTVIQQRVNQLRLFGFRSVLSDLNFYFLVKSKKMNKNEIQILLIPMKKLLQKLIWILLNSITKFFFSFFALYDIFRFVHLANIRMECGKLRSRLEDSKREVLSRRSSNEQTPLMSVLDAMIAVSLKRETKNCQYLLFYNLE